MPHVGEEVLTPSEHQFSVELDSYAFSLYFLSCCVHEHFVIAISVMRTLPEYMVLSLRLELGLCSFLVFLFLFCSLTSSLLLVILVLFVVL